MFKEFPASLTLHFLNVNLHESFECFEVNAFDGFALIVVIIDNNLLQSSDMSLLQILIKYFFL